jgi:hypothetical protein
MGVSGDQMALGCILFVIGVVAVSLAIFWGAA